MIWALLALLASIAFSIQIELNRDLKCNGFELNLYRAVLSALMLLPFFPFMEWPSGSSFYLVAFLCASISIVCMMVQYNLAASKNGRVANLHLPVTIFVTFSMWLVLDEAQRSFLIENPLRAGGVVLSFVILLVSIQYIRKSDNGWQALMAMVPVGILYAFINVVTKMVLDEGADMVAVTLSYVFLCNALMALIALPVHISKNMEEKTYFNPAMVKPGAGVALFHTLSWVMIAVAFIMAPNPAYPVVITALNPIWFMIYYKMRGVTDDASPLAGAVMVFSAIVLILATS